MKRHLLLSLLVMLGMVASAQSTFRHPGLMHSQQDFDRVKARIAAGDPDAVQSLANLRVASPVLGDHGHNWAVNVDISRGIAGAENYMNAYRNCARAYQCALLWKITGERGYGDVAVSILNDYANINKSLSGNTNISLIPAFNGYQFLNAAEIMRDYDGWRPEDIEKFKQYMIDVWFVVAQDFLERRHDTVEREQNWFHYYSNWGVGNELFCISLGIFCDLPDIYNYGMYWLTEGPGNESIFVGHHSGPYALEMCGEGWGLMPWFHKDNRAPLGYYAQMQESGRDQGHAQASLGLLGSALQTCYSQGDNLFCNMYNPLVKGLAGSAAAAGAAEYVAAYNDGVDNLPYQLNWWMGDFGPNSRGQWRPIWQVFINAYENRMGISMPYCHNMHDRMGLEWGGGNYGNNSGGYDHTGWGDLMFNDEKVTSPEQVPTVLYPTITGPTLQPRGAAPNMTMRTHHTGWVSAVTPGTEVRMEVNLPEGEEDTGLWEWEDGATGRTRTVTADHSALYRVFYTNSHGVKSTQLFSIAVRGEGIQASLDATISYHNRDYTGTTIKMGRNSAAIITTSYHNWNYIESEIWYDENGKQLAQGGSYTYYNRDGKDHTVTFVLTNQSGVKISKEFSLLNDDSDVSYLLPDAGCTKLDAWECTGGNIQCTSGDDIKGVFTKYLKLEKEHNYGGKAYWGLPTFSALQHATDIPQGKYRVTARCVATQQSATGEGQRHGVDGIFFVAGGTRMPVASLATATQDCSLDVYVGTDGLLNVGIENLTNQDCAYSRCGANLVIIDELELHAIADVDWQADLASLQARAALIGSEDVPAGVYAQLQEAVKTATATPDALAALSSAVSEAEMSARIYRALLQDAHTMAQTSGLSTETVAIYDALHTASSTAALYAQYDALLAAWRSELPTLDICGQDVSLLLQDIPFSTVSTDFMDNTLRWGTNVEGGNFRVLPITGSDTQRGDAKDDNMLERWCGANFAPKQMLIHQTLDKCPIGIYTFSAAAQKSTEKGNLMLYAGVSETSGEEAPITGTDALRTVSVTYPLSSTTARLVLGIKSGEENGTQWTSMSDVRLTYQSPRSGLKELVAQAEALLPTGQDVGDKLQTAVNSARQALEDNLSLSIMMTRYKTLKSQIKTFEQNNDNSASTAALALCTHYMAVAEHSVETTEGTKATFVEAIEAAQKQLETLRDPAKINTLTSTLEKAHRTYVLQAMPTDGWEFDYTFLVKNADCTANTGWQTDGVGNFQRMTNAEVDGEYVGPFWEKWDIESYYFKGGDRPVYQTIASLPEGQYRLHLAAFRKNQFNTLQVNPGSMNVFLNENMVEVTSEVLNYYDVHGETVDGTLTLGLKAGARCNANWEALADVHLYYQGRPGETAIEGTPGSATTHADTIYDLAGRRLSTLPRKGIVIMNNKTYIIR